MHFFDYAENGGGELDNISTGSWTTGIDLNLDASYVGSAPTVPSTATGVILTMTTTYNHLAVGARAYGSSTNRITDIYGSNGKSSIFVKCDTNQKIDIYHEANNVDFHVIGYFDDSDGSEFFTDGNQYNFNATGAGSWEEIDLSSDGLDTDANFAIIEVNNSDYNKYWQFCNPNGDQDPTAVSYGNRHTWVIVPCYNGKVRLKVENVGTDFYLVGQIIGTTAALTSRSDVSISTTGSYATVDFSGLTVPTNAVAAVIEVDTTAVLRSWAVKRYDDSSSYPDLYFDILNKDYTIFPLIDADDSENDRCQAKIETTGVDFYVWGWIENVAEEIIAATLGTIAVSGLNPSISAGTSIAATKGAVTVTGLQTNISAGTTIQVTTGTVAVSGINASISAGKTIASTAGNITVTGLQANISSGDAIQATTGTVTVAGLNADISASKTISATNGAVTVAGLDPDISAGTTIPAASGSITVTGLNATITSTTLIDATTGTVIITGLVAGISSGEIPDVPTERIYIINGEDRIYSIVAENRVYNIDEENRVYTIT